MWFFRRREQKAVAPFVGPQITDWQPPAEPPASAPNAPRMHMRRGLLPIRRHIAFQNAAGAAVAFSGMIAGVYVGKWFPDVGKRLGSGATLVIFFGFGLLGVLLVNMIFSRIVSARCPRCDGRAFQKRERPIRYECEVCGYVYKGTIPDTR
jgi:hypothetical protein